jgi:signal transduction histidine kinase
MDRVTVRGALSKRLEMQRIGTKLGFGIATLLGLCIIIGLVSYIQTRIVSQKIEEITEVKEPINSAVYGLENNLVETGFAVLGYLSGGDEKLLGVFYQNEESFKQIQKKYSDVADIEKSKGLDTLLRESNNRFRAIADEQIMLKNRQTETMESLLKTLSEIDAVLVGKIQASVKADDPLAFRRLQAALEMGVNANAITKSLGSFLITGKPQFESRVYRAEQDFKRYFRDYQLLLLSSEEKGWAGQLQRLFDESLRLARKVIDLQKARIQKLAEFLEIRRELDAVLNGQIQTRTEQGLADAKHDVLLAGSRANTTNLIVLLIALAFGTYTGILTTRNITGPLHQLVSVMNAIASGDYSQQADIRSSAELRSLSDSFNLMTGKLVRANEDLRAEILERQRAEDARRMTEQQLTDAERQRSGDLRRFALSVQRAQEEERQRISRELHDDVCQRLTGIKLRAEVLEDDVRPLNKKVHRSLRDFKKELDETIVDVRRISSNLRPSVLDDFGLVSALRLLCSEFEKHHGIKTVFQLGDSERMQLHANAEIALYRIAQEAFSNIAKHANASNISMQLLRIDSSVVLIVEDDGRGFNRERSTRSQPAAHGFGLISMRERSELLGGSFDVDSTVGKGTTIRVTIPVNEDTVS